MSDEKKEALMRELVNCFEKNDFETVLSLLTDDTTWLTPLGTFNGKEEVRRYLTWNASITKNGKFTESGVGILIKGDKASFEHILSAEVQGEKVSLLVMCAYEFDGDKIKKMRTVWDRLALAEQATNAWLPKKLVSSIASQLQKGLD